MAVFGDGDPGIPGAIADVFPDAKHKLCLWHLGNNFAVNIGPALGGVKSPEYKEAVNMWWRIAKETDERKRDTFDDDFDSLVDFVQSAPATTEAQEEKLTSRGLARGPARQGAEVGRQVYVGCPHIWRAIDSALPRLIDSSKLP